MDYLIYHNCNCRLWFSHSLIQGNNRHLPYLYCIVLVAYLHTSMTTLHLPEPTTIDKITPFFLQCCTEKMKRAVCKWTVLKWNTYFRLLLITFRYKKLTISSFLIRSLLVRVLTMVIGESANTSITM